MYTIKQINQTTHEQFMDLTEGIFEHSVWIAEKAEAAKPFSSLLHLHQAMVDIVEQSSPEKQLDLIKIHPNLGDRVTMTTNSIEEQKGAGLQDLTPEEYNQIISMNDQYMETFGFPFILAVRGKNKHQIYEAMETRIQHSKETEFETALTEIYKIALLRLVEKITS